jgi:23S rRNA pseudouridine2605 synthase
MSERSNKKSGASRASATGSRASASSSKGASDKKKTSTSGSRGASAGRTSKSATSGASGDAKKSDSERSKGFTKRTDKPYKKGGPEQRFKKPKGDPMPSFSEDVRLNKFIANAGICSRREADVLIQSGIVEVNGKPVTELGYRIKPGDEVKYDGSLIQSEKKRYVLLNKPKDFITTMDDPMGRRTVLQLINNACKERIYPVGRLDRNTTGVLLFTNDGDLAKKLTHPRYEVKKIYHVEVDKPLDPEILKTLLTGVELDDGDFVKADKVELIAETRNREVGVEIHSGKNRVVRRMFEAIGHTVVKLDRVKFAGLTKKDLPRGTWRHLTQQEVDFLRMT